MFLQGVMLGQRAHATAFRILLSGAFHSVANPSQRIVTAQLGRCRRPTHQAEIGREIGIELVNGSLKRIFPKIAAAFQYCSAFLWRPAVGRLASVSNPARAGDLRGLDSGGQACRRVGGLGRSFIRWWRRGSAPDPTSRWDLPVNGQL